jgi:hypothetical protein
MAPGPDGGVGHHHDVLGVREELRRVCDRSGPVGNCRGRFAAGNREFSCRFPLRRGLTLESQVLYLSGMYTRPEMALRIGLFYTAASLSGAFGGEIY